LVPDHALSFETLERALGLTAGSARRRRLKLLEVRVRDVPGTELRRNDRLVVEPGSHVAPGRLVVCHRGSGTIALRSVRLDCRGSAILTATDFDLLPLPDGRAGTVIGSVIGVLRVGRDACVSVAIPPHYSFRASDCRVVTKIRDEDLRRSNAAVLDDALRTLEAEVDALGATSAGRQLSSATIRLRALRSCLDAVQDERLYRALATEINANLFRLRRELAGRKSWAPLAVLLRPLSLNLGPAPSTRSGSVRNAQRQRLSC
jgi:hypothetical protein